MNSYPMFDHFKIISIHVAAYATQFYGIFYLQLEIYFQEFVGYFYIVINIIFEKKLCLYIFFYKSREEIILEYVKTEGAP